MLEHEKRIRDFLSERAAMRGLCPEQISGANGVSLYATDLRSLLADLDAMRAKAARYDYLSERFVGADFDWNESGESMLVFKIEDGTQVLATADETIDGAIAALKGASHE